MFKQPTKYFIHAYHPKLIFVVETYVSSAEFTKSHQYWDYDKGEKIETNGFIGGI